MQSGAQVMLTWNPDTDPAATGYYLVWGLSSGVYTATNAYSAGLVSTTINGLATNHVYYFNIAAFNSSDIEGPYAGEVVFTNVYLQTNLPTSGGGSTNSEPSEPPELPLPPEPPRSLLAHKPITGYNPAIAVDAQAPSTNVIQSLFWGVPPVLTMSTSNGQPNLTIAATVGATLEVESTPDMRSLSRWSEVTNVSITNIAPAAENIPLGQPQDALDLAFVPALQTVPLAPSNSAAQVFYRVVMPYDYIILASQVLPGKGCTPRLILVNMPGIVSDDVCYVNQASSFIHFDRNTYALQLDGSGSTIRQIATSLADYLHLSWTSASEFTYSNGISQILATVVETEPPSSDPIAGKPTATPANTIDF